MANFMGTDNVQLNNVSISDGTLSWASATDYANGYQVTDAGNATNTGRILVLNTTQWRVGFRRNITVEVDREPGKGQTTMYVSFRIALAERTGTRSTATHTALQYHITGIA
ncbi:MAG: hypothetical protein KJ755_15005 [Alphaproteobacteria bacterium]|nr:hypothetical protein [Alphaproteobacteria bacterium]